jgi:hypothetical protein
MFLNRAAYTRGGGTFAGDDELQRLLDELTE